MRYLKQLGLLAVAATALMAFAGTASATSVTSSEGSTPYVVLTSTNSKLDGSFVTIECSHSKIEYRIEQHGAGVPAGGKVSALSFTGCNYQPTILYKGNVVHHTTGQVTADEMVVIYHSSVGTCGFTTSAAIGNLTEGAGATIDINSAKIARTSGNFLCGSSGTWTGSYSVTSPSTLEVH